MKMIRSLVLGALALGALASPAFSAASTPLQQQWLCAPEASGAATGARRIVNPNTNAAYALNGDGCGLFLRADVGYFLTQGFSVGPNLFSIQSTGALTSAASATTVQIGTLPAGAYISAVMLNEIAGAAITGGVDLGTTASGTDYASAVAVGANALVMVADSALTRVVGVTGSPTAKPIFATCHTSCNAGSVTITVLYSYF
jgi:hypothetical protein